MYLGHQVTNVVKLIVLSTDLEKRFLCIPSVKVCKGVVEGMQLRRFVECQLSSRFKKSTKWYKKIICCVPSQ